MPYTLDTLPDAIKKLPAEAKDAWMKAYNAAYKQYDGDEGKSAAVAWSAIEKMGYHKNKDGEWVKAERIYRKDILQSGEYPHPQDPKKIIKMTVNELKEIADNTTKFIESGGDIPITISHPETEEEKIDTTQGYLKKVYVDDDTKRLMGEFTVSEKVDEWIKQGKLKSVSPGVYHDIVTSKGIFKKMIDHVAMTASPHNLGQFPFIPMLAQSYSSAQIFFGRNAITISTSGLSDNAGVNETDNNTLFQGGTMDAVAKLKQILNELYVLFIAVVGGKKPGEVGFVPLTGDGGDGNGGNGGITPVSKDIIGIVSPSLPIGTKATGVSGGLSIEREALDKLLLERDTLKKKIDEFETEKKKTIEDEKKSARTKFEARVDELIGAGKIKPANRDALMQEYETLSTLGKIQFEGKETNVADYILSRYETMTSSFKSQLSHEKINEIRFGNRTIDADSEEGKEVLFQAKVKKAKEMAKGSDKPWRSFFEAACKEVDIELFGEGDPLLDE